MEIIALAVWLGAVTALAIYQVFPHLLGLRSMLAYRLGVWRYKRTYRREVRQLWEADDRLVARLDAENEQQK